MEERERIWGEAALDFLEQGFISSMSLAHVAVHADAWQAFLAATADIATKPRQDTLSLIEVIRDLRSSQTLEYQTGLVALSRSAWMNFFVAMRYLAPSLADNTPSPQL